MIFYRAPLWQTTVFVDLVITGLVAASGDFILATVFLVGTLLTTAKVNDLRKDMGVA